MSNFQLNLLKDLSSLNAVLELVKFWSREIFYDTVFGSHECSSLFISAKQLYFSAFQLNWSPWSHLFGEIMTQNFLNNVLQKRRANLSYQVYLHVKKLVFVSAFPNICKCNYTAYRRKKMSVSFKWVLLFLLLIDLHYLMHTYTHTHTHTHICVF